MDRELDKIWATKRLEALEDLWLPAGDLIPIFFAALLLLGGLQWSGVLTGLLRTRDSTELATAKSPHSPTFEERWPDISRG